MNFQFGESDSSDQATTGLDKKNNLHIIENNETDESFYYEHIEIETTTPMTQFIEQEEVSSEHMLVISTALTEESGSESILEYETDPTTNPTQSITNTQPTIEETRSQRITDSSLSSLTKTPEKSELEEVSKVSNYTVTTQVS